MKNAFLGIDTSCYRTSAALYFEDGSYISSRKLLETKKGSLGLRQSDALFMHVRDLSSILKKLNISEYNIKAVGVSEKPTEEEKSYMPVFLAGILAAEAIADSLGVPLYRFTHQQGHIRAAMIGGGDVKPPFYAFHISGGTTECTFVDEKFSCKPILKSSDLKAGQAIDRLGVRLGFDFPAGAELDELSKKSNLEFKIKPSMKNGNPSFSGLQNKYEKMLADGKKREDVAKFVFVYIAEALKAMMKKIGDNETFVFSGGVSANSVIRDTLSGKGRLFASLELCGDNAVGVAALACDRYE